MEQKFIKDEELNNFDLDLEIPDISSVITKIDETVKAKEELKADHDKKNDKNKKKGKKKDKKQKVNGEICCCGSPFCGIGPMMETQG